MVNKTKIVHIYAATLFLIFFALLPFGQLLRSEILLFGNTIAIHPIDMVTFSTLPFIFLQYRSWSKYFGVITFALIASLIYSLTIIKLPDILVGSLHLVRIISYTSFCVSIIYLNENVFSKKIIIKSLLISIAVFLNFGFIQYFKFYDLRELRYLGWDDHYYRLTSTLFDPPFTSLILMIGLIISYKIDFFPKIIRIILIPAFFISILFTYSRAGMLTLLATFTFEKIRKFKLILLTIIILGLSILLLPRPASSGTELERVYSIYSRLNNYKETSEIFFRNPVFGVGFNNICRYKSDVLGTDNVYSHSCSGSDSSILLLLSTTGIVGVLIIGNSYYLSFKKIPNGSYKDVLRLSGFAVLFSSLFNNTLFYNSVMGILATLFALSVNPNSDNSE